MKTPVKITSLKQLNEILKKANEEFVDFFMLLNFGLRTSKSIALNEDGDYLIYHDIDDTEEICKHKDLKYTPIGQAIKNKAFYIY